MGLWRHILRWLSVGWLALVAAGCSPSLDEGDGVTKLDRARYGPDGQEVVLPDRWSENRKTTPAASPLSGREQEVLEHAAKGFTFPEIADITYFAFNAATAWMVPMYVELLGIDPAQTIDTHAQLANTGPVLTPTSLYAAAAHGGLKPGDLVLAFAIGNASNAVAQIHRWGEVALGPSPF